MHLFLTIIFTKCVCRWVQTVIALWLMLRGFFCGMTNNTAHELRFFSHSCYSCHSRHVTDAKLLGVPKRGEKNSVTVPGILGHNENWEHLILWEGVQKVPRWASFRGRVKQEQLPCPACTLCSFFPGDLDMNELVAWIFGEKSSLSRWMLRSCENFTPGGEYSPQQRAAGRIVLIFVSFSIRDFCWRKKCLQNLLFFIKEQQRGGWVCKQNRSFWRHFKSWISFCLI